jgi:hypothetical protein
MKGNNELILNEATMIEIVQAWLNANMLGDVPSVTGVNVANNISNLFKIYLASEDKSC